MSANAYAKLKAAFSSRRRPTTLLRSDLTGVDELDAADFLEGLKEGKNAVEFFRSAIPYFTFLTDEAAISMLPEFLQVIATDRDNLLTVCIFLDINSGRRVLSKLKEEERAAVLELIQVLRTEEGAELNRQLLDRLAEIIKAPDQKK